MKKQKKSNTKKILGFSLATIVLIAGVALFVNRHSNSQKSDQAAGNTQETVNLTPPTVDEKQTSEDNKQNLPDNSPTSPAPPSSGIKQATVTITSLDANPVRARVDGVVEDTDSGCSATFTNGSETFSVSSASVANVNHTLCAVRPNKTLSSGDWQVVVSYKSNQAEGVSAPSTVTVP